MKLQQILADMELVSVEGSLEIEIIGLENDSRRVKEGVLFVAIKGHETDGHLFCNQAVRNGASAILLEEEDNVDKAFCQQKKVTLIRVANSRLALAKVATTFYDYPAKKMNMVGITGTNGKTSTALLTYHILEENGYSAGLIGTICNLIHKQEIPAERTTPEAHELQKMFVRMVEEKVSTTVMEVSSHALELQRVNGMTFKVAVFTNLSLDHLDFHKTMENYLAAKSKLFQMAEIGIVNADDTMTDELLNSHSCKKIVFYSIKDKNADLFADKIVHQLTGTRYELHYNKKIYPVYLKTPGNFSVYNSLAAIGITCHLGIEPEKSIVALERHSQVRGRFQTITLPTEATAIIDYAHTPDGLENVLKSITEFKTGKIITVFGCGGDRDKSKRPLMAKIAEKYSDQVVITSDNPRTEEPHSIIKEIASGMQGKSFVIEVDRKVAIEKALEIAKKEDVVLIAGKGHEDYQIIGKQKIHFDDMEIVEEWRRKK